MKTNYMERVTYQGREGRKATVVRTSGLEDNSFGCKFYIGDDYLGIEWYEDKTELYAENAAENFIKGIKEYAQ
tara:strand:- start:602 stop:820 length:219 start_codon:yes stop_codon:yes gene_type:complete